MGAQGGRFVGWPALHQRYWSFEITLTARVAPVDFTLRDGPMMGCSGFFLTFPASGFTCYHVYIRIPDSVFQETKLLGYVSRLPKFFSCSLYSVTDQLKPLQVTIILDIWSLPSKSLPPTTQKGFMLCFQKALYATREWLVRLYWTRRPQWCQSTFPLVDKHSWLEINFFPFFLRKCMDPFVVEF